MTHLNVSKHILPTIVLSQFCGTSLWFAGNGVMPNLVNNFNLEENALSHLTSAVQFGFIFGTLMIAIFSIADRFSPSKLFFISALTGALCNLGMIWENHGLTSLLALRFLTGFCLAGIYPIGMKIAVDYYDKSLGKSLGFLVGALVLGTALPHLLRGITENLPWKFVVISVSVLSATGGLLLLIYVPDGPYRKPSQKLDLSAFFKIFRKRDFRSAAFGYFGHMWELYAFWAFVPVMLTTYNATHPESLLNIPILSFFIIGIGSIACIIGGYISLNIGTKKTAYLSLLLSGLCCIVSPLVFFSDSEIVIVVFLLLWGMLVIADSPLFSTLVAQKAFATSKGTALTTVNCIGFSITIISIQLLGYLNTIINPKYSYLILALGPILGLLALYRKK